MKGAFPTTGKKGNITAIYKKGSKANPGNYRPISLTSIICKLLEAIIRDAIVTHMSVNNLFCDQQHGFVPGRSCITQLLTTFEIWTQAVENGNPVDAIYLDFQKAFDSVPPPSPNTETCRLWSHRKNPTVDRNLPYGQKAKSMRRR